MARGVAVGLGFLIMAVSVGWSQRTDIEVVVEGQTPPPNIAIQKPRIDGTFPNAEKIAGEISAVLRKTC